MEKERRKHKRINKTMAVQIEDSYGIVLDLSKGGMRIIPDTLPKKIEDIRISFITEEGEPIELLGSITRIVDRKEKEGKYELGLALPKIPENYRRYIDALERNESPSGISQENVTQDLVKAVLEGKNEDLSIPKTEAPDIPIPVPHEAVDEDNLNIPLEDLLHEELEPDFPETPGIPPSTPGDNAPQEIVNIPLDELLQEDRQTEVQNITLDETVAMPVSNDLPPLDKPTPVEEAHIPLEKKSLLEKQPQAVETVPPAPQEYIPDETIVMPANRLPYQAPQAAGSGSSSAAEKKPAPQRVEISFEEFLQKNPQFNRPVTPPIPKTPPPVNDSSLEEVFNGETQPGVSQGPSFAPPASPTEDEESLDRVFKESPQPVAPPIAPEQEDDLSLDGIFTGNTPTGPVLKPDEEPEEDMSLDKIFTEQGKS